MEEVHHELPYLDERARGPRDEGEAEDAGAVSPDVFRRRRGHRGRDAQRDPRRLQGTRRLGARSGRVLGRTGHSSVCLARMTFSGMRKPLLLAVALCALSSVAPAQAPATLIINANVVDGTGAPARRAEVRIVDGKINSIGHWTRGPQDRVVDAHGLTLAPGFIDTHSHHDRGLPERRDALAAVSQGITTIVAGQDGGSSFPLAGFFARIDSQPAAINVASYVGHGTIRSRVIGDDYRRAATDAEVARMRALVREEMAAGAL
ncbi:MAG: hypothetical protein E6H78_19940, partial [Betaproteobacteria bacterium]